MFQVSQKIKLSVLVLTALVVGCSILKKDDVEKDIRVFLTSFQNSLSKPDAEILQFFNTPQSDQAIMLAVDVLRNKDLSNIECITSFDKALIYFEDEGIRVVIPTHIQSTDIARDFTIASTITLFLEKEHDSLFISKLEGDEFYNSFISLRNKINGSESLKKEILSRQSIFEKVNSLQQQYDSVIWYTQYDSQTYFYVVNGQWSNYFMRQKDDSEKPSNYKMGLVDQDGKVIIPIEYDLVGTLGFSLSGKVEVKKDGKVGYFNLDGKQIIATDFDIIIPYPNEEALIVKKDSVYGWFNVDYQYDSVGFPSAAAEEYVKKYQFLPTEFLLGEKRQSLCEIPNEDHIGYGIIIIPSYWTRTGIFEEIMGGFTIGGNSQNGYREYVETNSTTLTSITDKISALVTSIKERYLEGREEFYEYDRLIIVDANADTLATHELYSSGKIELNKLYDSLIELRYMNEGYDFDQFPVRNCNYIQLNPDFSIKQLESNRRFDFTQFVKMDSSYFNGKFRTLVKNGKTNEKLTKQLVLMRNEILAEYGYRFADKNDRDRFINRKWYKPEYDTFAQIQDKLTEIDKYNLSFLEKLIGPLKENINM